MQIQRLHSETLNIFSYFANRIKYSNKSAVFDINTYSEDFFAGLLNDVYGCKLVNLNTLKKNYPGLDLGESGHKSYQVTSDASSTKIKDAINKFIEYKHYESFDSLNILILGEKQKTYSSNFKTQDCFNFNPKTNIIDFQDICLTIKSLPPEKIEAINQRLKKELEYPEKPKSTEPDEVETICGLIELLSSHTHKEMVDEVEENPDPEGKILVRFAEHSEFLIKEYSRLLPLYLKILNESENALGTDSVDVDHIRMYLRFKSDEILRESNNNPEIALDTLTKYFLEKLSVGGRQHKYNAVKFYLLRELVQCNVFPKTRNKN